MAFQSIGETLPQQSTVVVIGDSQAEIDAGRALKRQWCDCTLKTIKLITEPKAEDLVEELRTLNPLWTEFVRARGSAEAHMEFA